MGDPRADFVVNSTKELLRLDAACADGRWSRQAADICSTIAASAELRRFMEDPSCSVLQVSGVPRSGGARELVLANVVSVGSDADAGVVFTKRSTEPITAFNVEEVVLVTSLQGSPLVALQLTLKQLYAPLLLQDPQWASLLDQKTASSLEALERAVSSAVQRGGKAGAEEDVGGILTPHDECERWRLIAMGAGARPVGGEERRRAEEVWGALMPVAEKLGVISQLSVGDLEELLEGMQDVLDQLFRAGYKEARMTHFLRVIGSAIDAYAKAMVARLRLWEDPYRKAPPRPSRLLLCRPSPAERAQPPAFSARQVARTLREALRIAEGWAATTARLISTFWAGAWKGGAWRDEGVSRLIGRLNALLALRSVHHQLSALLGEREVEQLKLGEAFAPFARLDPMHHSAYAQPAWDAANAQYAAAMSPVEQSVARRLQSLLGASGLKGHALLREYLRYKELVLLPAVFSELSDARTALLGQLHQQLDELRDGYEAKAATQVHGDPKQSTGKNLPQVVAQVVLAKQLQVKAGEMMAAADTLLRDLQGMGPFKGAASELHQYLSDSATQQFEEWLEQVESDLHDDASGLAMQLTGRLMEVNKDDFSLRVNYSDRLVRFLREVRQLAALGFRMSPAVQRNAEVAQKFYRHGVVLKQVANFYNTIDTQIVRSQKGLLLELAVRFEELATNPQERQATSDSPHGGGRAITWSNPSQLETYVRALHAAAEKLTHENRKLRLVHSSLGEQVGSLMEVSLLRSQGAWKEKVEHMRATVDGLQPSYPSGMIGWRKHWDMQLFKALECQYRAGLECLHAELPHITCELEFKQRRLTLRPAMEELRTEFYREIKKFISIPTGFKGLGYFEEKKEKEGGREKKGADGPLGKHKVLKIFRDMPDNCLSSLQVVYERAAELFTKLEALVGRYKPYVSLGMYEGSLDDLVESSVTEAAHFEANFKAIKAKRKEAEKLPHFERVDCLTVSLAPFKAAVEDQLQRLSDALLLGLRRQAVAMQHELDGFLDGAMETLSRRPQSVDEVGEAKRAWQKLVGSKEEQRGGFKKLEELNRLIRSAATGRSGGGGAVDVSALSNKWEELEVTLEAFNDKVEDQMAHLRGQMSNRVAELELSVQKFGARWFELKPKKLDTSQRSEMEAVIASIKGWKAEFDDVASAGEKLRLDCEHFGLVPPQLQQMDDVRADIEAYVGSCDLFEEYMGELDALGKEDWISFRQRTYVFDDFVTAWAERSAKCPPGAVADHLRRELGTFRELAPLLRLVRGDSFQPEHWATLFKKIDMEKVPLEKLCLSHWVGAADALVGAAAELRELNARAQGEVAIREAIQEVAVWATETSFTTTDYEQGGRTTPLIKDWKDLTTTVSDLQSLLSSLKDSPFFAAFADTVAQYETKLGMLDHVLALLNPIQRKWVYLDPIFGRGAMPLEQARFQRVDDDFRSIMRVT